jgi:GTP-binding protein HflX
LFERPRSGERAVLVHLDFPQEDNREELDEFRELTVSAGANPVEVVTGSRRSPHPRYFVGSGKAEEIRDVVKRTNAEVVLFNHALSPAQERNLEQLLECRVLDRTGLILDIFAQRAHSHEGKLQVELAQLKHLSTRLVRGWTHLERQKGGIGLRGPGETQLETDRRLLGDRIKRIRKRLEKVHKQRDQGRRHRRRQDAITVSLVGYTNAGKSTLFNRLSGAGVYAEDKLFATLDPTLRRVDIGVGEQIELDDTVGFIRHLPHDLVAAFQSTLEETREASLLLHVVDASSDRREENMEQVNLVLEEIGAEDVPQIQIFNKLDLIEGGMPRVDRDEQGRVRRVWVSAASGAGIDELRAVLHEVCFETPGALEPRSDEFGGEDTDFIESEAEIDKEDVRIA